MSNATEIRTIAQATDKALYKLDFNLETAMNRRDMYARMNARSKTKAYTKDIEEITVEIDELQQEIAKFANVYKALGGWERYIIVPGGHIHNYGCSTLFATTRVAEAYMHSAESVESLIEKAGDRACTVCFPDAPVNKPSTIELFVKEREQREAEAAQRAAKKDAAAKAAIVNAEGKVIFKSRRAAENCLSRELGDLVYYASYYAMLRDWDGTNLPNPESSEKYYADRMERLINPARREARATMELLELNGVPAEEVQAIAAKKFAAKMKPALKAGASFPEGFTF